ncbi:alpha-1,2-mannosyltransferase (plasmid) [Staphylococcus argenteus]|nr:alpha-1,2-mannosyltransferase [Staphylococcus argenteus]
MSKLSIKTTIVFSIFPFSSIRYLTVFSSFLFKTFTISSFSVFATSISFAISSLNAKQSSLTNVGNIELKSLFSIVVIGINFLLFKLIFLFSLTVISSMFKSNSLFSSSNLVMYDTFLF